VEFSLFHNLKAVERKILTCQIVLFSKTGQSKQLELMQLQKVVSTIVSFTLFMLF